MAQEKLFSIPNQHLRSAMTYLSPFHATMAQSAASALAATMLLDRFVLGWALARAYDASSAGAGRGDTAVVFDSAEVEKLGATIGGVAKSRPHLSRASRSGGLAVAYVGDQGAIQLRDVEPEAEVGFGGEFVVQEHVQPAAHFESEFAIVLAFVSGGATTALLMWCCTRGASPLGQTQVDKDIAPSTEHYARRQKRLCPPSCCGPAEPYRERPRGSASSFCIPSLTTAEEALLTAGLLEVEQDMVGWINQPDDWWDEMTPCSVEGLSDVRLCRKKKAVQGWNGPFTLCCCFATFDDVTVDELRRLTKGGEGMPKERFDSNVSKFQTRYKFSAPWQEEVQILRTTTLPAVMGVISAREVDDVCTCRKLPDGRWVEWGTSLQSPKMAPFCGRSEVLSKLRDAPPSGQMVRAIDICSGAVHEPLDDAARNGGRGRVRLWHFINSEAGGNIPAWAAELGQSQSVFAYFPAAYAELRGKP
mmetsp:Transcript_17622/g.48387  ORF Transcript_17622/g.48387 Transcript_17622/m.48387 type:complete len:475 (+) Transcript_17622:10-1434(+)